MDAKFSQSVLFKFSEIASTAIDFYSTPQSGRIRQEEFGAWNLEDRRFNIQLTISESFVHLTLLTARALLQLRIKCSSRNTWGQDGKILSCLSSRGPLKWNGPIILDLLLNELFEVGQTWRDTRCGMICPASGTGLDARQVVVRLKYRPFGAHPFIGFVLR